MILEDGKPYHEEVNIDRIKTIRSMRCLDGFNISPYIDSTHNDPTEVEHYQLIVSPAMEEKLANLERSRGFDQRLIHRSRIVRFDGVEVTPDEMSRNLPVGWGRSVISVVFDVLARYDGAINGATNMIKFWDLFTYKMKDYAQLAGAGEYEKLIERFAMIQRLISMTNGIIMDKDEEAGFQTRNYSGLSDIIKTVREELIAASRIPHTQLFGESPSGLGATGESEANTWASSVDEYQETNLRPKIQRILEMIFKAKDGPTRGKEPESWGFTFNPVYPETRKQRLEAESLQASNDSVYHSLGVLTKEEIRSSRFSQEEFSYKTILDDETWERQQQGEESAEGSDPYSSLFGDEAGADFSPPEDQAQQAPGTEQQAVPPQSQNSGTPGQTPSKQVQKSQDSSASQGSNALPQGGASGQSEDPMERLFQRRDSFDSPFNDPSMFHRSNYASLARKYNVA
jgi:hypothetical protein